MHRDLPSLDWLRVFAATAETESFALAAFRLGVTPGAVSQRIKALEAFLGIKLFDRYSQGVKLTEVGRRYAKRVLPHIDQLSMATREILPDTGTRSIRVTMLPALAQLWLGPRMDRFHTLYNNTTVEIWADATVIDLPDSNFDVAIRYGNPPFPGCNHAPFLRDEMVPVASPECFERYDNDERRIIEEATLILDTYWDEDFSDWLTETNHPPVKASTRTFSLYSMVIDATLNGQGFAMGHAPLVRDLIQSGRLKALSDQWVPTAKSFHLLTKGSRPLSEAAETFVDWITKEANVASG
jgi:LysR family transcriptional regulator, glycine cleavage system transcriptional activator